MKKLLYATTIGITAALFGCGKSVDTYNADLRKAADSILLYSGGAELVCSFYEDAWSTAISNGEDFSDAIAQAKETYLVKSGAEKSFARRKSYVDSLLKTLDEPPTESSDKYKKVLELYGNYSQYHDQALSPSGSLQSFRSQTSELSNQIVRLKNELKVMGLVSDKSSEK